MAPSGKVHTDERQRKINMTGNSSKRVRKIRALKVSISGRKYERLVWRMVGTTGFEPATSRTPSVRATRLRYVPTG